MVKVNDYVKIKGKEGWHRVNNVDIYGDFDVDIIGGVFGNSAIEAILPYGEEIEVWCSSESVTYRRIFIAYDDGFEYPFRCLGCNDEGDFARKEVIRTIAWKEGRPMTQPKIEIDIRINGKSAKLSDISEETLKKIRENEND